MRKGRVPVDRNPEGVVASLDPWCLRMKSKAPRLDCKPSDLVSALRVIGGKWKVRIICLLFDGTKRFSELRRMLPGIHRGTLTYELRRLEADRIVRRTQYSTIPPTVEYSLTIRGSALEPVLVAVSRWSKSSSGERTDSSQTEA
jgi:DNA-binding HxlR family transcriptional regulator